MKEHCQFAVTVFCGLRTAHSSHPLLLFNLPSFSIEKGLRMARRMSLAPCSAARTKLDRGWTRRTLHSAIQSMSMTAGCLWRAARWRWIRRNMQEPTSIAKECVDDKFLVNGDPIELSFIFLHCISCPWCPDLECLGIQYGWFGVSLGIQTSSRRWRDRDSDTRSWLSRCP
ncbi:hypothetical protein BJX64DRAFT_142107 [Aspergillus heterothallicus]